MNLKQWFADHSVSTHSIVAAIGGFVGIYTTVPGVKNAVDAMIAPHPKIATALGGIVAIVLAYKGSHSTQGQAAQLNAALASAPQATKAAIEVANESVPVGAPVVSTIPPKP